MELLISRQAIGLLLALTLGVLTGFLYDILRPFRRRAGSVGIVLLDMLFSFAAGICAFLYAMGAPSGRLGLWELFLTFAGFVLYMHTISDMVYKFLDSLVSAGWKAMGCFCLKIKKFARSAKNYFHIVRK